MSRSTITKNDIEIAVKVLKQCRVAKQRALGIAEFLGVNPDTPGGKEFVEQESERQARKLLDL